MSYLAIPTVLSRELPALAHEVAGWDEEEARSRAAAIFRRAYMAARGEGFQGDEILCLHFSHLKNMA